MDFKIGSFLKPHDYTEEAIKFRTAEKNHPAASRRLVLAAIAIMVIGAMYVLLAIHVCAGFCLFVPK
jgi:hypothetical protein